ncbi:uncharacterized protein G2W53_006245 [Senna tora]|uniref:Uncharacterized protein n=1 Tax=Senna tora TaxID=362788 RepID=A0A834X566_9FABA|nr:uncharacterized protein G2W53_006245 [Senna tora]
MTEISDLNPNRQFGPSRVHHETLDSASSN